jgi:hypothetical protein
MDLDLIYKFYIAKNNEFSTIDSVKEIIQSYREDFNNKNITLRQLCQKYLQYENVKNHCEKVLTSLNYSGLELEDYIYTLIATKYPTYFDNYYTDRYGMNRSELLQLVKVRTIQEEKDDFDYEKNALLLKDDTLRVICNIDKSYFQKLLTIFTEATLGGVIARVIYEKLHGELSNQPHDLSDIQNNIYLFRRTIENDYYIQLDPIILQLFEMFM